MTVIDLHTFESISAPQASVLCLGNFDGVHIGHQALISETVKKRNTLAKQYPDAKCGVWFFKRAPHDIITSKTTPLLTDFPQKLEIFSSLGLDLAFVFGYEEVGNFSPEKFVDEVLKRDCGCIFTVCGYNFKFGKGATGDARVLSELMDGNSTTVGQILVDDKNVCSSEIRNLIAEGKIEDANLLLGRHYSIHGTVLHGKKLGRTLGIPTINQNLSNGIALPKNGIYVSRTLIDGKWMPSVSNIGVRPSVEDSGVINCETYVLDFNGNLYGKDIKVEFLKRLRNEIKFTGIDRLKEQINKDIEETKRFFISEQEA